VRVLISAGEASGDLYASRVVEALKARHPGAEFFGCAGPRMQAAGVEAVVDQRSLAVVGIVEVLGHIPRIYGEFRKLVRAAKTRRPDLAILTDSPDFHLRLAKKLHALGVPVVYLIAPQAWAWRRGRVKTMRRTLQRLLCIGKPPRRGGSAYALPAGCRQTAAIRPPFAIYFGSAGGFWG
jgi:lipid-A-disaccharide synthase